MRSCVRSAWSASGKTACASTTSTATVFEIVGLGYPDPDIIPLLDSIGTAYDPRTIHLPTEAEYKEFKTGRCHPWAEDRVM